MIYAVLYWKNDNCYCADTFHRKDEARMCQLSLNAAGYRTKIKEIKEGE